MEARDARAGGIERQGPDGLRMRLKRPDAAAEARGAIARLRADLDPPLMETLRLLVTELVTNSVRHTDCQAFTLRIAVGKSAVLTEVADDGPTFDPEPYEDEDGRSSAPDTGWGLFLVRARPRLGREGRGPLEARLVRAGPRLERQLRVVRLRHLLPEQSAEALRGGRGVVAAVVVERHVHSRQAPVRGRRFPRAPRPCTARRSARRPIFP